MSFVEKTDLYEIFYKFMDEIQFFYNNLRIKNISTRLFINSIWYSVKESNN